MAHLPMPSAPEIKDERRAPRGASADSVYQSMYRLAHELGPNAKLPSVRALRARLGVSQATLESAFVRLERQRVLVRRERSGIYVALRLRERNVCLLCSPDFLLLHGQSPFWSLLLEQSRRFAQSSQMNLTLCFTSDLPLQHAAQIASEKHAQDAAFIPEWLVSDVREQRVQGVIAIGVQDGVARWLEARGVPVVAYAGPARSTVLTSRLDTLNTGIAALVERGCRRVCLLPMHNRDDEAGEYFLREERDGFQNALTAHGLTLLENGFLCLPLRGSRQAPWHFPSEVEAGFAAANQVFGSSSSLPWATPDAVLSLNDMQTQGFLMGMTRAGLAPGDDLFIATHANAGSPTLLGWQEHLIRLEYDPAEIMRALFEILDTLTAPDETPRDAPASEPCPDTNGITRRIAPRLILPNGPIL